MKQLLAVAINDLKVEFSNRSAWISLLVLPLIFTVVIGFATSGFGGDNRIPIGWVDQDGGAQALALNALLSDSATIRPVALDEAEALQMVADEELTGAVIIPSGFSENLLRGQMQEITLHLQQADNLGFTAREELRAAAARVGRTIRSAQISVDQAEAARPFVDEAERIQYFANSLAVAEEVVQEPPVLVKYMESGQHQPPPQIPLAFTQSSPGQLVTWVLATLLAGAGVLVRERTNGVLRRLLTTPVPKGIILGGKIAGRFTLGLAQMAVMVLFGQYVLGVQWGESLQALAMVGICFALAATALGLLIATIARTERQTDTMTTLGTFLLAPLGGAWVPLEITPPAFQTFSQIFPTTWAMRGFIDVIVRGQGVEGVLLECGILLGFAALFFGLGIWRFKYE
jgi:ABC-2 type transport system permease protein